MVGHWVEGKFDPRFLTRDTTVSTEGGKWACLRIWERLFQTTLWVLVNVQPITKINKGKGEKKEPTVWTCHVWENKTRKKSFVYIQEGSLQFDTIARRIFTIGFPYSSILHSTTQIVLEEICLNSRGILFSFTYPLKNCIVSFISQWMKGSGSKNQTSIKRVFGKAPCFLLRLILSNQNLHAHIIFRQFSAL